MTDCTVLMFIKKNDYDNVKQIRRIDYFQRFFDEKARDLFGDILSPSDDYDHRFSRMKNVFKALDLSKNQLTFIESDIFENFKNIHLVELSNNPIKSVHKKSFVGMDNLEYLYLDHCNLESIDFTTFSISRQLKVLNLSFNRLKRLDYSIIPLPIFTIETLLLENNQLTNFPFKRGNLQKMYSLNLENNNATCESMTDEFEYLCI